MIRKIISGGQTGADRAALDIAIKFEIPHGGYVPRGRKSEDGTVPEKYNMSELSTSLYPARTEKNIQSSDGTLILTRGILTGGSKLTEKLALKHGKPLCVTDLKEISEFQASLKIIKWAVENQIETLNVAGPRASHDVKIYDMALDVLETVLYLQETHYARKDKIYVSGKPRGIPVSLDEAVGFLSDIIPLRERVRIAFLNQFELESLLSSLSGFIMSNFNIINGNQELLESCRKHENNTGLINENIPEIIIRNLWVELRKTHQLRVIK